MKKKLISAVAVLLVLTAGIFIYHRYAVSETPEQLILYGNVDTRQVTLGFRVSGRIQEILVDEGDRIKTGEVIARLDSAPYRSELELARAKLAEAEAELTKRRNGNRPEEIARARAAVRGFTAALRNANAQHKRNEELVKTQAVADKEYDETLARRDQTAAELEFAQAQLQLLERGYRIEEIRAAEAQLAAAQAAVSARELDLKDCTLTAPEAGVVQTRIKEPGAIVAAGTGVITETLDTPVWIRAYVPEPLLGRIRPGMEVEISIDNPPDHPAGTGRIGFISPVAEFTPKSVETATLRTDLVYRIRIVAENGAGNLLQGMPVTVKIVPAEQ